MSAEKAPADGNEPPKQSGRRLRLLDHLSGGAFSDESLKDASEKIARLTQGTANPDVSEPLIPLGEVTDSITDSDPISPIQSPIQSPIVESVTSPNESPIQSPNEITKSSPNESPIQSPNEITAQARPAAGIPKLSWDPVLLTENQATLYVCLKQIHGAVTSLNLISQATTISEHTLKSCLKKLREHGLVIYGGRQNSGGRFGFTAQAVERPIILRGDRTRLQDRLRQVDIGTIILAKPLIGIEPGGEESDTETDQLELTFLHPMDHRFNHRLNNSPLSSSSKLQLQEFGKNLILEEHFSELDLRSLSQHIDQFETIEDLQLFLDMTNAAVNASRSTNKPIQNPRGFLFAQLRAGYINPPPDFKSRRVRAQEVRNGQLQAEVEELRRLQEEEIELRFELFKGKLTEDERKQIDKEAKGRVKPGAGFSEKRQLEIYRDEILREWFEQPSE